MAAAVDAARRVRRTARPNPWVGCVVVGRAEHVGATAPPGGPHAEVVALAAAGDDARGAEVYVTLEPCSHVGRTPPCADALIAAGVRRVVVGVEDPDPRVAGRGIARLREAGIEVTVGVLGDVIAEDLAPYLHHRRTGRPYVVGKVAMTLDGRTAAPDGSSRWITGPEARRDAHALRADSDAILVGAGTVRADDPALTVRHVDGPDPRRIVLGTAPPGARVRPCLEWRGELADLLDRLGSEGVLQLLIEGGASTLGSFWREGLLDRLVCYVAPAVTGGDDARGVFAGPGAPTIGDVTRGRIVEVRRLGADVRIDWVPDHAAPPAPAPGDAGG